MAILVYQRVKRVTKKNTNKAHNNCSRFRCAGGKGHFHFGKDPVRHVDSQFYVPDLSKQTEEEHFKHFVSSAPRFTCPICKLHFRRFTTQLRGLGDFVIYFFCFVFPFFL